MSDCYAIRMRGDSDFHYSREADTPNDISPDGFSRVRQLSWGLGDNKDGGSLMPSDVEYLPCRSASPQTERRKIYAFACVRNGKVERASLWKYNLSNST